MSHNLFFPYQLLIFSTYTRLYQNNYNNEVFIDCLTLITLSIAKKNPRLDQCGCQMNLHLEPEFINISPIECTRIVFLSYIDSAL